MPGRDFVLLIVPTGGRGAVLFVEVLSFSAMFLVAPDSFNLFEAEGMLFSSE